MSQWFSSNTSLHIPYARGDYDGEFWELLVPPFFHPVYGYPLAASGGAAVQTSPTMDMSALPGAPFYMSLSVSASDTENGPLTSFFVEYSGNVGAFATVDDLLYSVQIGTVTPRLAASASGLPSISCQFYRYQLNQPDAIFNVTITAEARVLLPVIDTGPGCFWKDFINCAETC